jgi:hypothetical protein
MRADLTPEQVRAAGIYLNGGRRRGWKQRLAGLLATPQATISAWSTRSAGNARPIPGVAAVAIKLLVAMMRQELMVTAHPDQAGKAVAERLMLLLGQPQPAAADERPITVGVQRARLLGVKPVARDEQLEAPKPDRPASIPLGVDPEDRRGRPGSAA